MPVCTVDRPEDLLRFVQDEVEAGRFQVIFYLASETEVLIVRAKVCCLS